MTTTKQHLCDADLVRLKRDALSIEEKLEFLEHLSSCEECSERYSASFHEDELITIPFSPEFSPWEHPSATKQAHKNTLYNLRVIVTTAAAVAMVLFMPLSNHTKMTQAVANPAIELFEHYDALFKTFSNKINDYEVKK